MPDIKKDLDLIKLKLDLIALQLRLLNRRKAR